VSIVRNHTRYHQHICVYCFELLIRLLRSSFGPFPPADGPLSVFTTYTPCPIRLTHTSQSSTWYEYSSTMSSLVYTSSCSQTVVPTTSQVQPPFVPYITTRVTNIYYTTSPVIETYTLAGSTSESVYYTTSLITKVFTSTCVVTPTVTAVTLSPPNTEIITVPLEITISETSTVYETALPVTALSTKSGSVYESVYYTTSTTTDTYTTTCAVCIYILPFASYCPSNILLGDANHNPKC
jgi:hypothetical protein